MTTQRRILYRGRVQGVGFRYTVKQLATGYEVTGWVRNLPDGQVELQVQGDPREIADFLETIASSQLRTHIHQQDEAEAADSTESLSGFEIRH